MKKATLSLIVAGTLAAAGLAQAQYTYDTPVQAGEASTMSTGQPNLQTAPSDPPRNAVVMGAGPSTVMVPVETYTAVQPGWRDTPRQRHQAAATFNTPARAGEASTMTGGVPNQLTDNAAVAADVHVPVISVPSY